jgi:hypothetical protein
LEKLRVSGLDEGTLYQTGYQLAELNEAVIETEQETIEVDLFNPEQVKTYIANRKNKNGEKTANSYKNNLLKSYTYFVSVNGIQWTRPYFHYERKIPKYPQPKQ